MANCESHNQRVSRPPNLSKFGDHLVENSQPHLDYDVIIECL